VGTVLVVTASVQRLVPSGGPSRVVAAAGAVAVLAGLVDADAGIYGSGPALGISRVLTAAAAAVVATWLVFELGRARAVAAGVVVAMTAAGIAMVVSSPRPPIDVWFMLQAAGTSLSHGHDIYTSHWTSGVAFEQSDGFAYLPGAAVALWPFHALLGDVRYGLLAAMALTAVILVQVRARSSGVLLGVLVLLFPRALFGLEQSWVDPLVLLAVCATAWAVSRGRPGWAVLCFAACLTCKQQAWVMLPLAFVWRDFGWRRAALSAGAAGAFCAPWVLADPHAFWRGAVTYNLDLPARLDSLSLYRVALAVGWEPGVAVVAALTLGAVALAWWRLPRDTYGFLLGSAMVMAVFNLANKQSFFNEWQLAAGLVLAAVVFGPERPVPGLAIPDAHLDAVAVPVSGP
jgi:hypothetical protein